MTEKKGLKINVNLTTFITINVEEEHIELGDKRIEIVEEMVYFRRLQTK